MKRRKTVRIHAGLRRPVSIEVPEGADLTAWSTPQGPSMKLVMGGLTLQIRCRGTSALQFRAPWLPEVFSHDRACDRMSAGTDDLQEAVNRGLELILQQLAWGTVVPRPAPEEDPIRLSDVVADVRGTSRVPGASGLDPAPKTRQHYEFILDLAEAILSDDPEMPLSHDDVERFSRVRARPDGFRWPHRFRHRRALKPVTPQTIEKNLKDLQTVLSRADPDLLPGGVVFRANVQIRPQPRKKGKRITRERHGLLVEASGRTESFLRREGLQVEETVPYRGGSRTTIRCHRFDLPTGLIRVLLLHQVVHPVRPRSWRHVEVENVATSPDEVRELVQRLTLESDEWGPPNGVEDTWRYGAIRYLRRWSKLTEERIIPLPSHFGLFLKAYLDARSRWLAERDVESPWLYPSPTSPKKPLSGKQARLLLSAVEAEARRRLEEEGKDPDRWVPQLKGARWYGLRRYASVALNERGWQTTMEKAYAGDWSYQALPIHNRTYAGVSPTLLLALVEGETYLRAQARLDESGSGGPGDSFVRPLRPDEI